MVYNNDYRYIFLHDDQDRRNLMHLNSVFGRAVIIAAVCDFAVSVLLTVTLESCAGENPAYIAIPFVCGGLFFVCMAVAAIIVSIKSKRILGYSLSKLTQTPADSLKRELHSLYARSQRAGNIMFIAMSAAGIIAGVVIAIIGHSIAEEPSPLLTLIATTTGISLLVSICAAFVIWAIMFAAYRRKARPIERRLILMPPEEGDRE